jgi:Caspase domain/Bacterial SH3 domain
MSGKFYISFVVAFWTAFASCCHASNFPIPYPGETPNALPQRHAFVVGIDYYSYSGSAIQLSKLDNAVRDAFNAKQAFEKAGFSINDQHFLVSRDDKKYISRNDILSALSDFELRLKEEFTKTRNWPVVAFYFAGHGLSARGRDGKNVNYIIPSDFTVNYPDEIPEFAIPLSYILNKISNINPSLKIFILDACRNEITNILLGDNDQQMSLDIGIGDLRNDQNIARLPSYRQDDTYYLYSTKSGATASDAGYFTNAFAKSVDELFSDSSSDRESRHSFDDIHYRIRALVPPPPAQTVEFQPNGKKFIPFPTKKNFDAESSTWERIISLCNSNLDNCRDLYNFSGAGRTKLDQFRRLFCLASDYSNRYAYSYFYEMARSWVKRATGEDLSKCREYSSLLNVNEKLDAPKSQETLTVGALKTYADYGINLPQNTPLDKLAISSEDLNVRSKPTSKSKSIGVVQTGHLFTYHDGAANEAWLPVGAGGPGYVASQFLFPAYVSASEVIPLPSDGLGAKPDLKGLTTIFNRLGPVVVGDIKIEYADADGAEGFSFALSVYDSLTKLASPISGNKSSKLVPAVLASGDIKNIPKGFVKVKTLVLPLQQDVRASVAEVLAKSLPEDSKNAKLSDKLAPFELRALGKVSAPVGLCDEKLGSCLVLPELASENPALPPSQNAKPDVRGLW